MESLSALILFAFVSGITPGPNNIMIMASGLNFGIKRSLPHFFGICLGFPSLFIMIGMGFGLVFDSYPWLHELIKIVGIIYLLYFAWLIAHSSSQTKKTQRSKPLTFVQGFLFQWLNPKAWIITTSAVAAYSSTNESIYWQVLFFAFIFFLVSFPVTVTWLLGGNSLQRWLKKPSQRTVFNYVMAILLVLSISPALYQLIIKYL